MRKGRSSKQKIIDLVRASPAARVKVAVTDIDGVLRGKYIHKEKFLSAIDAGFGFCNVVFGWDMGDQCYDNATWTGWHTGFPDALAKIDLDTYRRVPWDDNVPFFLADFVDGKDQPSPVCPRQLLKKVLARIYVHESIHVDFVDAFVATVRGFKIGDPRDDTTYIGPLTRKAQLAVLKRQVADARKKGASLLLGGKPLTRKGHYFAPTVLSDVDHRMELMREESFGPVIGIQKVKDDFEAVRLMNDTAYGLTAGVYTPDRGRAEKILAQIKSGSVYWNCCDRVSPRLPWSGLKHSGFGLTLSTYGIQTFLRPKAWHLRNV